jgi:hypothetical protein
MTISEFVFRNRINSSVDAIRSLLTVAGVIERNRYFTIAYQTNNIHITMIVEETEGNPLNSRI